MTLSIIRDCIIPAGQSLSNAVDCSGSTRILRILTPAEWTGNASLTFQMSDDDVTYRDLWRVVTPGVAYNSFEVVVPRPPPNASITMPLDMGGGVAFVRVRSGTALVPVAQDADREFQFVTKLPDPIPASQRGKDWVGKRGVVRLGTRADGTSVAVWQRAGGRITVSAPGAVGQP
jgi:hypothetical protein